MPYNNAIPQANDQISVSQNQILQNFASINTTFDQNHVDFNAGGGIAGQHVMTQFQPQAAAPGFGATAGFWANAASSLFLHNIAGTDVNISDKTYAPAVVGGGVANYFYLPCGLLVKFGCGVTDASGHLVINLDAIGVAYAGVPYAFATGTYTAGHTRFTAIANVTQHLVDVDTRDSAGTAAIGNFQWLTIGI